jgi:Flp pilus assembly protein TadG
MRAVTEGLRRLLSHARGEEGASIVETAVASTVFLAMLIGVFQMMLALYTFHFISDAAREATRYAIVRGSTSCVNTPGLSNCNATTDQIRDYVRGLSYPGIVPSNLTVTTTWLTASTTYPTSWSACTAGTCNAPGNQVNVLVTYSFPFNVPFVPKATFPLTSSSEMVISQ